MRIINFPFKAISFFVFILIILSCVKKPEEDPCLKTKWPQSKEMEIKLAVHILPSNPLLPGITPDSQNPSDFENMIVSGTIEKIDCSSQHSGAFNLGNSYINKGTDIFAPINVSGAYWIGYVVYVYDFGNDNDHLDIKLAVKITMKDGQSYMCNIFEEIFCPEIIQVPGGLYYYILSDVYSDNWFKFN